MSAPVLLVGAASDAHIAAVAQGLDRRGVEALVVDTLSFPEEPSISLGHSLERIIVAGHSVGRPTAVYIRDIYVHPLSFGVDVAAEMDADWRRTLIAFREKAQMLLPMLGRFSELGVPVYNPMTMEWRYTKALQIALLDAAGIPVPETVWTNDPDEVRAFAADRRVVYKPVGGGAATRELGPEDLTDERLATLGGAPVTFQELVPGDNMRVYCIDGDVVATLRIEAETLDYRQNETAVEQAELPDEVLLQCVRATEVLGLRWSGIDIRGDADSGFRFLELNTSPMFLGFDRRAGSGIADALCDALASHVGAGT